MTFGGETDEYEEERPISIGEASDVLHRYGLTEEDIPLARVSSTPPSELEKIASEKIKP